MAKKNSMKSFAELGASRGRSPKALVPKIRSLGELRQLAQTDDRYRQLALVAAENLGWASADVGAKNPTDPRLLTAALRWLSMNADETGSERGVVSEVNFVRDLI